jgi:gas vesicle structural protein
VSLVGIDLITVEARIVVASIDTYLRYAEAMGITQPIARPGAVVSGELSAGEPLPSETTETRTTRARRGDELA